MTGRLMTVRYNVSNVGAGEPYESYWQDIAVSRFIECVIYLLQTHSLNFDCTNKYCM